MSILHEPEMELELPFPLDAFHETPGSASDLGRLADQAFPAFKRIRDACAAPGSGMVMYEERGPDFEGYVVVGPPTAVLRLIPGLYEREHLREQMMGAQQYYPTQEQMNRQWMQMQQAPPQAQLPQQLYAGACGNSLNAILGHRQSQQQVVDGLSGGLLGMMLGGPR